MRSWAMEEVGIGGMKEPEAAKAGPSGVIEDRDREWRKAGGIRAIWSA